MKTKPYLAAFQLLPIALISILGFTANVNANTVLVGLTDDPYPADHDFQDLTFSISAAGNILGVSATQTVDWQAESGQSIATGTPGQLDGNVTSSAAANLAFTYGPPGLPGATGHGDAINENLVWFSSSGITTEAAAIAAGDYFANFTSTALGVVASTVGKQVIANNAAGEVDFQFNFNILGGSFILNNSQVDNANGAYLAAAVTGMPEPGSLALLAAGCLAGTYSMRRRIRRMQTVSVIAKNA